MMGVRSLHFRGSRITHQVREQTVTTMLLEAGPEPLTLVDAAGKSTPLVVGVAISAPRGRHAIIAHRAP